MTAKLPNPLPPSAEAALDAFESAVDRVVRDAREDGRPLVVRQGDEVKWVPASDIPLSEEVDEASAEADAAA